MILALIFVIVCLLIVAAGGFIVRAEFRPPTGLTVTDRVELQRLTVLLPPARVDLADLNQRTSHRSDETAPPWPAGYLPRHYDLPPTIGEVALNQHFPVFLHEVERYLTDATVQIGAPA